MGSESAFRTAGETSFLRAGQWMEYGPKPAERR